MPKPICLQSPTWDRVELDALEILYTAGWSWPAVSAHISQLVRERSADACRVRAQRLGVAKPERRGRPAITAHDADLEDMVILGYSTRRMAAELGLSQSWVAQRIPEVVSPSRLHAWRSQSRKRLSRTVQTQHASRRAAA
jgi:hypothetical protein